MQRALDRAVSETAACTGTLIQIALNYSGRQELVDVVRKAAAEAGRGRIAADEIDETWIEGHLSTHGTSPPATTRAL